MIVDDHDREARIVLRQQRCETSTDVCVLIACRYEDGNGRSLVGRRRRGRSQMDERVPLSKRVTDQPGDNYDESKRERQHGWRTCSGKTRDGAESASGVLSQTSQRWLPFRRRAQPDGQFRPAATKLAATQ
jgi:hypothetical protein